MWGYRIYTTHKPRTSIETVREATRIALHSLIIILSKILYVVMTCQTTDSNRIPPYNTGLYLIHVALAPPVNGCLAWYNVVLTPRIHSTVKYR